MNALSRSTPFSKSSVDRVPRRELERRLRQAQHRMHELEQMAFTDVLTGLRNRRYLEERLQQEISRCRRKTGISFSVLAIDVNGFKQINDTQGHQAGDRLLQLISHHLTQTLRAHDVVCRTGGDEFLVVLPDAGSAEAAAAISRVVRGLHTLCPGSLERVSLSIGAASFPSDGSDASTLIRAADEAMYEEKRRLKAESVEAGPSAAGHEMIEL